MSFNCGSGSDKSSGASRGAQSNAKMVRTNQKSSLRLGSHCMVSRSRRTAIAPALVLDYIKVTAANLHSLACGVDFRLLPGSAKISSDQAVKLIASALSLCKQRKRNAFAALLVDRDDMRAGLTNYYYGRDADVPEIEMLRRTTPESARRRIARGKRLIGVKRKSSLLKI
jgi:hypothetical protein